jgi:hypothetical protein
LAMANAFIEKSAYREAIREAIQDKVDALIDACSDNYRADGALSSMASEPSSMASEPDLRAELLASLKEMHAFAAACMRVAVKPEHAEFAAALDAEVAAAGIAEGFGIRAQEAIEKATVTHG